MIELNVDEAVAELVLARVDARNAINRDWVDALGDATATLAGETGPRALLIRAEGPAFTVGGDLGHFQNHVNDLSVELRAMVSSFHESLRRIAELKIPVVCAAHGSVAGGGLGLLWASDVVFLAPETKLTTAFAKLGLSGDGGSSWYLPRLVGQRKALQLMFNATVLSAQEAVDLGLADAVVPAEQLQSLARARASELAAGPTLAYATMRRLIRGSSQRSLAEGLDAETAASTALGASGDAQRGVRAFAAGERPDFAGD